MTRLNLRCREDLWAIDGRIRIAEGLVSSYEATVRQLQIKSAQFARAAMMMLDELASRRRELAGMREAREWIARGR